MNQSFELYGSDIISHLKNLKTTKLLLSSYKYVVVFITESDIRFTKQSS